MSVLLVGNNQFVKKNLQSVISEAISFDEVNNSIEADELIKGAQSVIDYSEFDGCRVSLLDYVRKMNTECRIIKICPAGSFEKNSDGRVVTYNVPELFGKWDIADKEGTVNNLCKRAAMGDLDFDLTENAEKLLYIDDLINDILKDITNGTKRDDNPVPIEERVHSVTCSEIKKLLNAFTSYQETQEMVSIPRWSFEYKLFSTFNSYIPFEKRITALRGRGTPEGISYTPITSQSFGMVNVSVYKPGAVIANHWHSTKIEYFMILAGKALVRMREVGTEEVREYEITGKDAKIIKMVPGDIHSIQNASDKEDLVVFKWSNEKFYPKWSDTYTENV